MTPEEALHRIHIKHEIRKRGFYVAADAPTEELEKTLAVVRSQVVLTREEYDFLLEHAGSFIDHWVSDDGMDAEEQGEAEAAEAKFEAIEEKYAPPKPDPDDDYGPSA